MPRPFVKWAGGKSGILADLVKYIPEYRTYYEPFLGGGALFFALQPQQAILADSNGELINTYKVVRNELTTLISILSEYPNDKEFFLQIRAKNPMELSDLERAARFIYLNKTCYNGLYRVNKRNEFNTPFGNYKNPKICDLGVLRIASKALQNAELIATYFENSLKDVTQDSFVYLDPPYLQVKGDSFVSYSKRGFDLESHEKLADEFDRMHQLGAKVMLSNSDTVWANVRYQAYNIIKVKNRRSINSNGAGRGKVSELLILNY